MRKPRARPRWWMHCGSCKRGMFKSENEKIILNDVIGVCEDIRNLIIEDRKKLTNENNAYAELLECEDQIFSVMAYLTTFQNDDDFQKDVRIYEILDTLQRTLESYQGHYSEQIKSLAQKLKDVRDNRGISKSPDGITFLEEELKDTLKPLINENSIFRKLIVFFTTLFLFAYNYLKYCYNLGYHNQCLGVPIEFIEKPNLQSFSANIVPAVILLVVFLSCAFFAVQIVNGGCWFIEKARTCKLSTYIQHSFKKTTKILLPSDALFMAETCIVAFMIINLTRIFCLLLLKKATKIDLSICIALFIFISTIICPLLRCILIKVVSAIFSVLPIILVLFGLLFLFSYAISKSGLYSEFDMSFVVYFTVLVSIGVLLLLFCNKKFTLGADSTTAAQVVFSVVKRSLIALCLVAMLVFMLHSPNNAKNAGKNAGEDKNIKKTFYVIGQNTLSQEILKLQEISNMDEYAVLYTTSDYYIIAPCSFSTTVDEENQKKTVMTIYQNYIASISKDNQILRIEEVDKVVPMSDKKANVIITSRYNKIPNPLISAIYYFVLQ